jgi:hypothetical protein
VAEPDAAADLTAHCAAHHRAPGPRSLAKRGRDVEQAVAPSQHHHDREFAKRRFVAICIAQGDAPWQRRDIDAVCSGKRHLQQAQLRRCRKSASPSSGQQYIRIGERRSRLCRLIVIKDFGTDVGSNEFNDWRSLRGGERSQEQRVMVAHDLGADL